MTAHMGVDTDSSVVHSSQRRRFALVDTLLHGQAERAYGDSGYTGTKKRKELHIVSVYCALASKPSAVRPPWRERRWAH